MMRSAPTAAPSHQLPLIARLVRPRQRAGMSSSMAELIAAYSPPTPAAPVKKRKNMKLRRSHDNAVKTVAAR